MRTRSLLGMWAIVLLGTAYPAWAEPVSLKPTSKWQLNYDEDKCRLVREFGEGPDKITFLLDQAGVEPFYTLSLVGERTRRAWGPDLRVQFGAEEPTVRSYIPGKLADGTPLVVMHGVTLAASRGSEPIGEQRERAIEAIVFDKALSSPLTLQSGTMGAALQSMRECVIDLSRLLDKEGGQFSQVSVGPKPIRPHEWMGADSYPAEFLRKHLTGTVYFRLTVDKQGKPTACHVFDSTRPQVFDDVVCLHMLKRGKFEPAQNSSGQPVAAYWRSSVRFVFE